MLRLKVWIKNRLERLLVSPLCVSQETIQRATTPPQRLQIIIPHRLNWPLTIASVGAFERFTTGDFGITVVVNFDTVPADWTGWKNPRITLVRNRLTLLGSIFRKIYKSQNGSMENALAIEIGLRQHPALEWAFIAHSDSAPLTKGWNEVFFSALGTGLVIGNTRDEARVFAAHAAGTLFHAGEFRRSGASPWPTFRFGKMIQDVGDGISETLHPKGRGLVPVLPNTRQTPELCRKLEQRFPLLYEFALAGTHVTFDAQGNMPVYAHLGRGTPRSEFHPSMKHKLPVEIWVDLVNSLT